MALYTATTEGEEALAAATLETLLQIRGATTTKARLIQWQVSFDSITAAAEPVLVQLVRQTTDGTGTGATECKVDPDDPAAAVTAFHSFSAEPTTTDVLEQYDVYPGGIPFVMQYPLGDEYVLQAAATSRLAIVATAPAVVNAVAGFRWRE